MRILLLFLLGLFSACQTVKFTDDTFTFKQEGKDFFINGPSDSLQVNFLANGNIRLAFLNQPENDFSFIDDKQFILPKVIEHQDQLLLQGATSALKISKSPWQISLLDQQGKTLSVIRAYEKSAKKSKVIFSAEKVEAFYGMGQKTIPVNRKGYAFSTVNNHVGGYSKPYENLQVNIPYLYTDRKFGVFFDNSYTGNFDLCKTSPNQWSYQTDGGQMVIYFTVGEQLQDLQNQYFALTGYPSLPPKWVFGLMQSKCSYQDDKEVYKVVEEFQANQLPLDAIILDANWFGGYNDNSHNMGNFTWEKNHFPNPKGFMQKLKDRHIKTLIINEPQINQSSENFEFLKQQGWLMKVQDSAYVLPSFWAGSAALLDLTNPSAQDWLWKKQKANLDLGLDAFWVDLTEPDVSTTAGQFFMGEEPKVHNIYSYLFAQVLDRGMKQDFPDRRLYNITRAGTAGMHKFGAFNWSGDAAKNFDALALQVPMLIGCSMSGMPHFASDIGGFTNAWDQIGDWQAYDGPKARTSPELYTRWFQFGVFSPILRPHSGEDQSCEPYAFDQQTLEISRKYLNLRYRLIPYIYSYAAKTTFEGEQLIKPMMMKFDDPAVKQCDDQYLFGNLLVAPVVKEGADSQLVYLPKLGDGQKWFDFFDDQIYEPGEQQVAAGIDKIPVFVSSGTIYPLADLAMNTASQTEDHLTVVAYRGTGAFNLYEDDGTSRAYETGQYSMTDFVMTAEENTIQFEVNQHGKLQNEMRSYTFDFRDIPQKPLLKVNGQAIAEDRFDYDENTKRLTFNHPQEGPQKLVISMQI